MIHNKRVDITATNEEKHISELLDSSYHGVRKLFVLSYDNTAGENEVFDDFFKKYFLAIVKIGNCNIEIDGKNFFDQPINDSIKQYDEVRKYRQGRVIITLVACWILLILKKKIQINCC